MAPLFSAHVPLQTRPGNRPPDWFRQTAPEMDRPAAGQGDDGRTIALPMATRRGGMRAAGDAASGADRKWPWWRRGGRVRVELERHSCSTLGAGGRGATRRQTGGWSAPAKGAETLTRVRYLPLRTISENTNF